MYYTVSYSDIHIKNNLFHYNIFFNIHIDNRYSHYIDNLSNHL